MNHTRYPKEDHLPDWARRYNKVTKGDRADILSIHLWSKGLVVVVADRLYILPIL